MWQMMSIEETKNKLKTNLEKGLTSKEVLERRVKYGLNKLIETEKESIVIKFVKQFNDFMIIILILAAVISAGVSYIQNSSEYLDSIIILFIVVLNAFMGTIQEEKAEKALEALKNMSAPTAKVKRDGVIKTIPSSEIVPGDYIFLETGSYAPADARLVKSYNLKMEESALTGETIPMLKNEKVILNKESRKGRLFKFSICNYYNGIWTRRSNSYRNWNEHKSWKNSKNDYTRQISRNSFTDKTSEK